MKLPDKRIAYAKVEHSADGLLWIAPLKGENLRQLKRRVVNSIHGHGIRPLKFRGYVLKEMV
jgi:hypothetical protein